MSFNILCAESTPTHHNPDGSYGIYGVGDPSGVLLKTPPPVLLFKEGESKMVNLDDMGDHLKDGWAMGDEDLFLLAKAVEDCKDPAEQAELQKNLLEKVLSDGERYFPSFKDKTLEEKLSEEAIRLDPSMIFLWWPRLECLSNLKGLITIACKNKSIAAQIPASFIEKNPEFWFRIKCTVKENFFWDIKKPQKR